MGLPLSVKQKILLSLWLITFMMLTLAGTLASLWFAGDQAKRLDDFLVRESHSVRDLLGTVLAVAGGGRTPEQVGNQDFLTFVEDYFQDRVNRPLPYKTTLGVFDRAGNLVIATNTALDLTRVGLVADTEVQLVTVPGSKPFRLASVPLFQNSEVVGTIRLACLTVTLVEAWDSFFASLAIVLALVFVSFGLLGTSLIHWSLRPVRQMSESALSISDSHLDLRLAVPPGNDEVALMAKTLNKLLAQLEQDFEFEEALVGQLSHELRTPLAILRATNEMAVDRKLSGPAVWDLLEDNLADIDQIVSLLNSLLSLARIDGRKDLVEWRPCDLGAVLQDLLEELTPLWEEKDLSFHLSLPGKNTAWSRCPPITTRGDPILLRQAVLNVLTNAFKYTPAGRRIHLSVEEAGTMDAPLWSLVIRNPGPPIPEDSLDLVFKRFYRVEIQNPDQYEEASGLGQKGFGLGLSISKTMVELHNGTIRAFNPTNGGAAFEIRLPRSFPAKKEKLQRSLPS
jgi:signal transduction histidine kinase